MWGERNVLVGRYAHVCKRAMYGCKAEEPRERKGTRTGWVTKRNSIMNGRERARIREVISVSGESDSRKMQSRGLVTGPSPTRKK